MSTSNQGAQHMCATPNPQCIARINPGDSTTSAAGHPPALPSWLDAWTAVDTGTATALQRFIAEYEPSSQELREPFRALLGEMLRGDDSPRPGTTRHS